MVKDKDSVKERILIFEESISKESKIEYYVSLGSQVVPADDMVSKSLIEKIFEVMSSAIQNSWVVVREDMAKEATREDFELKLMIEKVRQESSAKRGLGEKVLIEESMAFPFQRFIPYSNVEHIGCFTIQCGEVSNHDFLKLRLFPYYLTGTTFEWYTRLSPDSIEEWHRMEVAFHRQFYHRRLEERFILA
ncbi:hypothetical protein ACH5RR_018355 [Cinchona calisaya]|uniref:Retrotransposon gag domain-containing protein n=1 Tax=Cinchona calisaya TaxID=153742 RepID=A0ABD2ZL75_9GENT